ncbi:L-dopachrome tautomerase-related protein [Rhodopirellula sallentina]|uniref:Major royal jelly protein n=1 Tax=Rhodopirellula sallentina SM41 TaxID=1263870 RepID=M5UD41_9BACT|nr:L-dopachrome tautomerase-related protein [Rhodopirellula sallentina]EMI55766.1 major royal jelly protein [Rhodopirellula sallentina SM41]
MNKLYCIFCIATSLLFCIKGSGQEPSVELDLFAQLDQAVGNIAYTHDGTLVLSHHPFFKPDVRVATYDAMAKTVIPFPNEEWNTPRDENDWYLDDVLGLRNDSKGVVWMLDMGTRNNVTPKLVAWDTNENKLHRIVYVPPPASLDISQLNDFVIDEQRNLIVIADEGIARGGDGSRAALVVVDLTTGIVQRVLQDHPSTTADRNMPTMIDGDPLSVRVHDKTTPIFVGADGITLDANNEWLYFCPLNGGKIYRLPIEALADHEMTDEQLGEKVETYSDKVNNGGLSIDHEGNLYFTNVGSHSIGFVSARDRTYSEIASDVRMQWPDGISYNRDGYMYVSAAQVHLGSAFNDGKDKTSKPFYIFRFRPLSDGIFGR